ncbi:MAG TPA: hypothetical protein VM118_06160 [Acidobacteriota bacterium]|nr:hypothetical protein [Acidobacteriota bacterium]
MLRKRFNAVPVLLLLLILSCSGTEPVEGPDWVVYNTVNSDLRANTVTALAVETDGDLWIGYPSGWLSRLSRSGWLHISSRFMKNGISDLVIGRDSLLWMAGADGAGILDAVTRGVAQLESPLQGRLTCVTEAADGTKWFGGDSGAVRFDGEIWTVFDRRSGLSSPAVTDIRTDGHGDVWAGSRHYRTETGFTVGAVSRYDGHEWHVQGPFTGLPGFSVHSLAVDTDGSVWAGFIDAVGHNIDGEWGELTVSDATAYVRDTVNVIAVDARGVKWFGTPNGLIRYDGTAMMRYTTANSGLGGNDIRAIVVDSENTKWIGTSTGGLTRLID